MQVITPVYGDLKFNDGEIKIGLTDPWHDRVKWCAKLLKKVDNTPLSLVSSPIAKAGKYIPLVCINWVTDEITLVIGE